MESRRLVIVDPAWSSRVGHHADLNDALLGEMGKMVNPGQKVVPVAAARSGYRYAYPELRAALDDLFR